MIKMIEKMFAKIIKNKFEKNYIYTPYVENVTGIYDIFYSESKDAYQSLDVYYPKETKNKLPIIFNVHGGAWVACDKNMNRAYSEYLAGFGYCVVNMSYRLLPKTDIYGQLEDVKNAIAYTMKNIDLPCMDKDKIILMGDSAGAHIASVLYCMYEKNEPKTLPIKALVLQNMVCDLSDFLGSGKWLIKKFCKLLYGKKKASEYENISFLGLVDEKIDKIPVFIVGSENDPLYFQTKKMQEYLKQNGWETSSVIWKKEDGAELGHVFQVSHPLWPQSQKTHEKMFDYLKEVLHREN